MDDIKSLIVAFLISLVILTAWDYFVTGPQQQTIAQQEQLRKEQLAKEQARTTAAQLTQDLQNAALATPYKDRQQLLSESKSERITIKSPELDGSIWLKGLRFDDLRLAQYKASLTPKDPTDNEVVLLAPSDSEAVHYMTLSWQTSDATIDVPNSQSLWQVVGEAAPLTPDHPIELAWQNNTGQRFTVEIALDEHYMFTLKQRVQNNAGKAITLFPSGTLTRSWHPSGGKSAILHLGALGVMADALQEFSYADLKDKAYDNPTERSFRFDQAKGWIGFTDKYWLTSLVPGNASRFTAHFFYNMQKGQDRYQADYLTDAVTVDAGGDASYEFHFFAGAKKVGLLDDYAERYDIPLFDRAVDFGWLYFLTKPIFVSLTAFHHVLGNFGLAILALTVVIKILLFPMANKSYRSFAQMKKLTPQMQTIREQYKEDRLKQNQEMMALYKREKVNPLSGCLPLLIQLPVFFALYKVLNVTIEMRHAPFYGFIHDLSAKDPTNIFNLFGLIPWTPPSFLMIGILPLIMGATMIIQQQLNPAPTDPVQAKMMKFLPLIFTVVCAGFPAGLVVYWIWNNTLSIIQQAIITRNTMQTATA